MSATTTITQRAQAFLAERHRLGFQARTTGYALLSFARFMDRQHPKAPLTIERMTDWARRDKWQRRTPETWARRLKQLRPFARWLRQFEPRTEVPDESVFGPVPGRVAPHVYREDEIVKLLAAARQLNPRGGLRPATYETLLGLIASAGLRVSEALALRDRDVRQVAATAPAPKHGGCVGTIPAVTSSVCTGESRDAVLRRYPGTAAWSRVEPASGTSRFHRVA
jgi:site-specific recombinase XerD